MGNEPPSNDEDEGGDDGAGACAAALCHENPRHGYQVQKLLAATQADPWSRGSVKPSYQNVTATSHALLLRSSLFIITP